MEIQSSNIDDIEQKKDENIQQEENQKIEIEQLNEQQEIVSPQDQENEVQVQEPAQDLNEEKQEEIQLEEQQNIIMQDHNPEIKEDVQMEQVDDQQVQENEVQSQKSNEVKEEILIEKIEQNIKNESSQIEGSQKAEDKPKLQNPSQLLWQNGSQKANLNQEYSQNKDDSSEYNDFSNTFEEKCHKIQQNGLYNLNSSTYQVACLNNMLSNIGLRMEFKETVILSMKKKEKERQNQLKELKKKQKLQERDMKKNQKRQQLQYERQRSKYNPDQRKQKFLTNGTGAGKSFNGYQEGQNDDNKTSMSDAYQKNNEKSFTQRMHDTDKNTSQVDNSSIIDKSDSDVSDEKDNIDDELEGKFTQKPLQQIYTAPNVNAAMMSNVSDLRALSPTPRKSERERKNISYDKMNKGEKDDSEDLNMRDTGISQLSKEQQKQKKMQLFQGQQQFSKKYSLEEAKKKINDFFVKFKEHANVAILNQPLDKQNPYYEKYLKNDYKTLNLIEMKFRVGDYQSSQDIAKDFNSLLLAQFEMTSISGSDDYYKVVELRDFFDREFDGIKELPLTKQLEQQKSKPSASHSKSSIKAPNQFLGGQYPNNNKRNTHRQRNQGQSHLNKNQQREQYDSNGEIIEDHAPVILQTGPVFKPLSPLEMQELREGIGKLNDEQRAGIEELIPDCISHNEKGQKNIELSILNQFPEQARKLEQYVKQQVKKQIQKQQRKLKDQKRREEKKQKKNNQANQAMANVGMGIQNNQIKSGHIDLNQDIQHSQAAQVAAQVQYAQNPPQLYNMQAQQQLLLQAINQGKVGIGAQAGNSQNTQQQQPLVAGQAPINVVPTQQQMQQWQMILAAGLQIPQASQQIIQQGGQPNLNQLSNQQLQQAMLQLSSNPQLLLQKQQQVLQQNAAQNLNSQNVKRGANTGAQDDDSSSSSEDD